MNITPRALCALAAALSLGVVPALAVADPAGKAVQVGNLATPDGARAFDQQLDRVARETCAESYAPNDLQNMTSCIKSVREEALEQLSPAQRQAYNAGETASADLASAHQGERAPKPESVR